MNLLLDDYIERNPDSLVTITFNKLGIRMAGILSDPQLTTSLTANYGDGAKAYGAKVAGGVSSASNLLKGSSSRMARGLGAAGSLLSGGMSMASDYATDTKTLMGTLDLYENSGKISVPFNAHFFYDWQGNKGFKEMDLEFNYFTQPKVYATGHLGSYMYDLEELKKVALLDSNALKGVLPYVTLGDLYMAKDVYIHSVTKSQSTILNEDGYPAGMQVSFSISPYRQLTAKELNDWILR